MTDTDISTPEKGKPGRSKRNKPVEAKRARKATKSISKSAIVVKLLARRSGATVAEISGATGWQSHSVRAFFSGLRRKGMPLMRVSHVDGSLCYRLVSTEGPEGDCHPAAVAPVDAPVEPQNLALAEVREVAADDDTEAGA